MSGRMGPAQATVQAARQQQRAPVECRRQDSKQQQM